MNYQAGLSEVGGLSANFHDPSSSVMSWLTTGLSMVQGKPFWSFNIQIPYLIVNPQSLLVSLWACLDPQAWSSVLWGQPNGFIMAKTS